MGWSAGCAKSHRAQRGCACASQVTAHAQSAFSKTNKFRLMSDRISHQLGMLAVPPSESRSVSFSLLESF